ncbi:FHA domain-containing protein [Marinagarivorans algicola]|uniref:FHA domain-containing protein n=1 Tax=Marinagarivorans algicola TaxID=1513270 RepID=UPI0006B426DB|nr:FHA domain-containing protein [Marinagarivorans algicola]
MSAIIAQMVDGVVVHRFELSLGVTTVGRQPDNDIVIQDPAVSGAHAHFLIEKNQDFEEYLDVFVEDFGSTNGTFVNNLPAQKKHKLVNNDVVRFGFNEFQFIDGANIDMTRTVHMAAPGDDTL